MRLRHRFGRAPHHGRRPGPSGRRRLVGGQEDMIADIALDFSRASQPM
ncbi:MAG: hypothetical protein AB1679_02335 [Actinomycetota bacterium]